MTAPQKLRWMLLILLALLFVVEPAFAQRRRGIRSRGAPSSTNSRVVVIGSGITGLCAGALLAKQGQQVTVLEMHPTLLGGHARTLNIDGLEVSAGPQYVWNFGAGQVGFEVLRRLGLESTIHFDLLDADGFDQLIVGERVVDVPIGLDRFRDAVIEQLPDERIAISRFFSYIKDFFEAVQYLHDSGLYMANKPAMVLGLLGTPTVSAGAKFRTFIFSERSLGDIFDLCGLSDDARRLLYGQSGLFAENAENVSVVVYSAAIGYLHSGPRIPREGFRSLVDGLCDVIRDNGGNVLNGKQVVELTLQSSRITQVKCVDGTVYPSDIVISSISPRLTAQLIPDVDVSQFDYQPSNSLVSCYLKVDDYPLISQLLRGKNIWWQPATGMVDYDAPDMTAQPGMLFVTSPSAIGGQSSANDAGEHSLVIFAPGNFEQAKQADEVGQHDLLREQILDAVLAALDEHVLPDVSQFVQTELVLTPWDIKQELGAERGNAYGKGLDAFDVLHATTYSPYAANLFQANATIGLPGIAPAFQTANLIVPTDGSRPNGLFEIVILALTDRPRRAVNDAYQTVTGLFW